MNKLAGVVMLLACLVGYADGQKDPRTNQGSEKGYRLEREATYMIVVPNKIYPNEVVQVQCTFFKMYHNFVNVRITIHRYGEEWASLSSVFTEPSTRFLQMRMRDNAPPGNYSLRVEGSATVKGFSGNLFENETDIYYSPKQVSVFIQTNKPIYRQGQTVHFRVVPVHPNLLSAHGSMDVYVEDATKTVVKRWLAQQTNLGVTEMKMNISEQPAFGTWRVRVDGWGYTYYKNFDVEEFWLPRFYVNVSMPSYIMADSFGLAGVVEANFTSGHTCRGNAIITMEIMKAKRQISPIQREVPYFNGRTDFLFMMSEIKELLGEDANGVEIRVNATVFDWFLMQNRTGSSLTVVYGREVSLILLGDMSRTFKPGFPVTVYWAVVMADGSPLYGQRRQVTISRTSLYMNERSVGEPEEKLIVPDDGILRYEFTPHKDAKSVIIRAYYDNMQNKPEEIRLHRHYTYFGNYISVSTSTERPVVDEYMIFTVRTSVLVDQIFYLVVAAGNIVAGNRLDMHSMQKTFSVAVSRDMSPSAAIVVYYVQFGEVVADSLHFYTNGTYMNPVDVRVNLGKDFTRDTVELTGITDPGSYICFSGVDWELYRYGSNPFLTEEEIIDELMTYSTHINQSHSHTWFYGDNQFQKVFFPAGSYAVDANTTFTFSGLSVFTDANVTRLNHPCNETRGYLPCNDGNCYEVQQRCDGARQCSDGADELGCPRKFEDKHTPISKRLQHITRHYEEDASWIWKTTYTKPDGRVDKRATAPKWPISWLVSAFAVSTVKGLGIMKTPARFEHAKPFYIIMEMPKHAYKGEQLGVRVELHNFWHFDMECLVMLHESDRYKFVVVDDYHGQVNSYTPTTRRGNFQTMVYVPAGQMMMIHMPILPTYTGRTNVTISSISFMGRDTLTDHVDIEMDGVTNHYNTPYMIDLINQGSQLIPDFYINVTERFTHPEFPWHYYVPGSAKAYLSIVGDVVGPGFFERYLDAENMMRSPTGSAEQNIFNFATNYLYLDFFRLTNQLNQSMMVEALDYMNMALQRQLSYFNDTHGYFFMFRDYRKQTPSTWVTAMSLLWLERANEADWWDYYYTPTELLNKIATWLCRQQNKTTGAFFDQAPVYDQKLYDPPVMIDGEMKSKNISLTASVLIALASAQGITGTASTMVDASKTLAMLYLEGIINDLVDPYQTALVTYALTVANSKNRNNAFKRLQNMKRVGEYIYWSDVAIPSNPTEIVNTVPIQSRRIQYGQEAKAVETTAYALLVYLRNNRLSEALSIMKWLQTMRNSIGGYGGTRDSLVALEALTTYGARDTNRDIYNMEIKIEMSQSKKKSVVRLNRENWSRTQFIHVPEGFVFGYIKAYVMGTGIALMQLHTQVNVEYPWLQDPQPNGTFYDLEVERLHFYGKNFSIMEMTVCAKWKRKDLRERTGLTIIELDLPTGYEVVNDVVREHTRSNYNPRLGRAESWHRKMIFYLDYLIAGERSCVSFRADRWFPAANMTIQHYLKVYDAYEPGMFNRTLYRTYDLYQLHICQVCGSFQCPYCPYYNVASSVQFSIIVALVMVTMATWLSRRLASPS